MKSIAASGADVLLLADMAAVRGEMPLRLLLDRLGLLDPSDDTDGEPFKLRFGGTHIGAVLLAEKRQLPWSERLPDDDCGVGEVSVVLPGDAPVLQLWVDQRDHDRQRHLQQVQHLCAVAAMIGEALQAARIYWSPAQLWSPMAALVDAVAASETQGLPPIMHLVAFLPIEGAEVVTRGLAHFGIAELQLSAEPPLPFADAVRRLARLAVHALMVGPMSAGAKVPGLLADEVISFGKTVLLDGRAVTPVQVRRGR